MFRFTLPFRYAVLLLWLAALAPGFWIQSAHAQQSKEISAEEEKQFETAMAALDRGETAQAEVLLKPLQARHPDLYPINESLGLLYAGQGRMEDALPLLKAAVNEQPTSDVAHANLGSTYYKMGKDADALRELEQAAKLKPDNAATQQSLGELWMRKKQPEQAARAFAAALRLRPDDADLSYDAALAFQDSHQPKAAQDTLAHMQGVEKSAAAQSLYGDVEEALGNFQEAIQHYTNAAKLDPGENNLFMLGAEFLRHWTFEPAILEFNFGVLHFPESAKMQLGLGVAYYGNANYDKAVDVFARLLEADPENALYAEMMGRTCTVQMEAEDQRCEMLVTYAKRHPHNALISTFAAAGIIHGLLGAHQEDQARSLLDSAITEDPKSATAQYEMGLLLQMEEQWEKSIPYLESAIRLQPSYSEAHYRLGLAYARVGRKDAAQTEMVLFRRYNQQAEDDRNAKLRQITLFVVEMR
jgi:tetratricopeptide (TPR) repeat protein